MGMNIHELVAAQKKEIDRLQWQYQSAKDGRDWYRDVNKTLIEALEYINNIATAGHRYNELELKMVLKAREALK